MARTSKTINSLSQVLGNKHPAGNKLPPGLQPILAHGEKILRANRLYESIAPAMLVKVSRIANIKSGLLVIHADHGAAAAKLRQMARFLIQEFEKRGFECNDIDVRVQDALSLPAQAPAKQKPLSEQALTSISKLQDQLPADDPLRAHLAHLVDRAARR